MSCRRCELCENDTSAGGISVAALQHVLHLQAQAGWQPPQVDVLVAGTWVFAGGDKLLHVGAPVAFPPVIVAEAEHRRALGPQAAVADPAGRRRAGRRPRRRVLPRGQVRVSDRHSG